MTITEIVQWVVGVAALALTIAFIFSALSAPFDGTWGDRD